LSQAHNELEKEGEAWNSKFSAAFSEAEGHNARLREYRKQQEEAQLQRVRGQPTSVAERATAERISDIMTLKGGAQSFADYYTQGLSEQAKGNQQAALIAFRLAEDLAPDLASRARAIYSAAVSHWVGERDASTAFSLFDRIEQTYGSQQDSVPGLAAVIARSVLTRGVILKELGRLPEAVACFKSVVTRFGRAADLELRALVAAALVEQAGALARTDVTAALASYDQVTSRFSDAGEPALVAQVLTALCEKGYLLLARSEIERAKGAFHQALEKAAESVAGPPDAEIAELVGMRADEMITRLASEPQMGDVVEQARLLKAQLRS
jgi:tetratricopeptide (TPR) repeat protein